MKKKTETWPSELRNSNENRTSVFDDSEYNEVIDFMMSSTPDIATAEAKTESNGDFFTVKTGIFLFVFCLLLISTFFVISCTVNELTLLHRP